MQLPPQYNPKETEDTKYRLWEESGFFNPDKLPGERNEAYSIVMPPPNVTGTLHIGHALMLAIQDILIRFERMREKRTLWLPGTDHAAIATQSKVEAILLKEEEKTRYDYGREEFLKRVEAFAQSSHDSIIRQVRRMGASCDWSREAYTLDETRTRAVREAFRRMYEGGVIYRGKRIVNWDPKLQTTVSDDEIEWKDEKTPLYYLKYGPFTIATARPETKFGDKYVVMHPEDKRYAKYAHGKKIELEWINGPVTATVIKDPVVDKEFGTGVMTITPWHDMTDFDIAERHKLEFEQIIDFNAKLLPVAEEFAGIHIKKARPLIVEKLKTKGLLEKTDENYSHRIATNSRGGGIIEPQIKEQWFVGVNKEFPMPHSNIKGIRAGDVVTLKRLMRHAVESGEIKILPDHFGKIYYHWIDNLRDWCISRQIWYGHRVPVWYHEPKCIPRVGHEGDVVKCKEIIIAGNQPACEFCDATFAQDPDTLDTWFSSGLWTFSTLGWPEKTPDLNLFHPTSVMETGYDILFFWVARMILMTTYLTGDVPFHTVYLHGLVRDAEKKKMSKSKGNNIDPLDMIEKYGADALRFSLIFATAAGSDVALQEDRIKGMKHFANKLWNIARFILGETEAKHYAPESLRTLTPHTPEDTAVLTSLWETLSKVSDALENFRLHEAAQEAYQFTWHELADNYIEASKKQLGSSETAENTKRVLAGCLSVTLKILHPFMPFVTEEIWGRLPKDKKSLLMIEPWPEKTPNG